VDIYHRANLDWRCDCGVGSTNTNRPVLVSGETKYSYFPSHYWKYTGPSNSNIGPARMTKSKDVAQSDFSYLWTCFDEDVVPQPVAGGHPIDGTQFWQPWLHGSISPVVADGVGL
jgi:hypothetical protein